MKKNTITIKLGDKAYKKYIALQNRYEQARKKQKFISLSNDQVKKILTS